MICMRAGFVPLSIFRCQVPTPKKTDLKDHLARCRQIKISVIGRKSGRTVSIPVCFVFEGEKPYLLPMQGSDTQWYRNALKNPSIGSIPR
jgi:nitroimidazol reductase NimA-like FMN-containing flavoprotein (pyridoxamine 5'-phosphate oxidase superfamily)